MLPQLDPGMGPAAVLRQKTEWGAVAQRGQNRAGRKISGNPNHISRIDTALSQHGGYSLPEQADRREEPNMTTAKTLVLVLFNSFYFLNPGLHP